MSSDNIFKNSFQSVSNISTNVPYLNVSSQTVDKSKVNNLNVENNLVSTNFNLTGDIQNVIGDVVVNNNLNITDNILIEGLLSSDALNVTNWFYP
jgi:predicted acyltransferase (DUF342 family)